MALTDEQYAALIAQHGPETGNVPDPRTVTVRTRQANAFGEPIDVDVKNPDPTYIVTFQDGTEIRVMGERDAQGNATGRRNVVDWGTIKPPGSVKAEAAPVSGGMQWNPTTQRYDIPVATTKVPTNINGEWWSVDAEGNPQMVGSIPSALEDRGIAAQQRAAAEQRAVEAQRQAAYNQQLAAIKMAMDAGEIDAKRYQELREWLYKTEVEFPEKQRQQEDVLKGNALTYGQQAGTSAVSDVTSMLPYRYSPGFGERRAAALEGAAHGNYRPQAIARGYTGPDLAGTRQQAERQYQNQYLQQFGFDPQQVANQVSYRQPGVAPTGAQAAPVAAGGQPPGIGAGDDEEYLKELARQLAG